MSWASWASIFRTLMPRGGDKASGIAEEDDFSDPLGDGEGRFLLNESDETIALDAAFCASLGFPNHGMTSAISHLTSLSREAAQALAQQEGTLGLTSLTTLSAEAARALAQRKGSLILSGLTTLSEEAAKALQANEEICFLDDREI